MLFQSPFVNPVYNYRQSMATVNYYSKYRCGDETKAGTVVSVFLTKSSDIRYVVQDDLGVLSIYSEISLKERV